ncbi:MAG: acyltransferase [Pelagibacterales bacterium]|nr:acyltransferase [Pelagibacterales bacterium]
MKNYNPEIDGLRAIAVISVIFYHAEIIIYDNIISKSGFIGVDIFIVISGFVITRLFFNKDFSYSQFIERRLRRLVPALLFLILTTTAISYFFLLPQHFVNLGQSILANILLISNFLFFYQTNYWDYAVFTKPLLHTWTIALEFQFYILICIIFWLFRKNYTKAVILFFLISIILLIFSKKINFELNLRELSLNNYFLIFTRLWEFLTGSLIAIILNNEKYLKTYKIKSYFNNIGIILILISLILIETPKNFPNLLTIIPVVGTSIILLANNKQSSHMILNNSLLIHLGKISYSLYLWHFPILIFFLYKFNFELNIINKLCALIIIYFVSLGSYKFIEIPFFKNNILTRKSFGISLAISSLAIFFLGLLITNKIVKSKSYSKYENIISDFSHYNLSDKVGAKRNIMVNQFTNSKKTKILICGDSHGGDLVMALQSNRNIKEKYEIEFLHFLSCINEEPILIKKADYTLSSIQLKGKNNLTYNDIKKLYNIVTVKNNKKFIIVGASPEFQTDADLLLNYLTITNMKKEDIMENIHNINKFFFINKKIYINSINEKLYKLSKELDVGFLDKFDYICKEKDEICFGVDLKGNKNFIDYSHLSKNGRVFFGNEIVNINWLKLNKF